ncbi:MAG TPA: metallophosphoesterase [Pseudomonadales bacterium]
MTAPLTVLQISDTHLLAPGSSERGPRTLLGVDTAATLAAVLDQALAEARPDAIVASGDLAHEPEPETYRHWRRIVERAFDGPVLCLPGNHDLSAPFRQVFGDDWSLEFGAWEILAFDTHADDRTEAEFDEPRRRALLERLDASPADHVLLVCHHHPRPVDCPWLDKDRIPGGDELLDALAAVLRVRALLFGHVHQEVAWQVNGKPVLGVPSTCFQFLPRSERFAVDASPATGRPGYRWLTLDESGGVASRVERLAGDPMHIDLSDRS